MDQEVFPSPPSPSSKVVPRGSLRTRSKQRTSSRNRRRNLPALTDVLAVARQDRGKSRAIDNFEPHTRGPCLVTETRKIGFFDRAIRAEKDPVGRGTLTANRPEVASELSCCVARLGRIFDGDGRFAGSQTDEGIRYASARLAFAG